MDYMLIIFMILALLVNAISEIWVAKVNREEQSKNTAVIYFLYKELKRHNDNFQGRVQE